MARPPRFLSLVAALTLLAACANPSPTAAPSPTRAPSGTVASATEAPTAAGPPPAVAATPTPTVPPLTIGYIAAGAGTPGVFTAVEAAAAAHGWVVQRAAEPTGDALRALISPGASILVADGPEFEAVAHAAAVQDPRLYVIGVGHAGLESGLATGSGQALPNLLALGGPASRQDQLGFMAGAVAGFLTEGRIVTAIADTATAVGLKYRNGFLHGVRYTCSRCRVDFIDLADESATAFAAERARLNASLSSDVVFAAAGEAGWSGLRAAAQAGAWVIGAEADAYEQAFEAGAAPGADRVATSVYFDLGAAVRAALDAYAAGSPPAGAQPPSATNGAVALAPYRVNEEALSGLDRQEISAILARLADLSLDTGIDPLTGSER
ncbi:MAG: BMP family ABC transporter substrate-binding protein [Anaerolineales bacterium]|nr:BMP family ABC transporter substrate-binding protein [Anaerolineales bacterium]